MNPTFIHLRIHTEYSLIDGLPTIDDLIASCVEAKMPAIAITDQSNLFALVKFYKSALNAGIKPIMGADFWLHNDQHPKQPYRLTLLCQNNVGYKNLTQLISQVYIEGQQHDLPILQKIWLEKSTDGLIALSGGREGDVGQALLNDKKELAKQLLDDWQILFPDRFYLELQRVGHANEEVYNAAAIHLANENHLPLVATNDVRFIHAEDFEAHEARVCINSGYVLSDPRRPKIYTTQQYLRSLQEMQTLFSDVPEALINTVEIAKRCNLQLSLNKTFLPNFPIPTDTTAEQYLIKQAQAGLLQRFATAQKTLTEKYSTRLQTELAVINSMGFAGYFLIVADFIRWAKENGVPVGPGRGSGAGSLVAYVLGITDLDPLQYDLLFERFLNPERVSLPDFDVDFCMDGRDRVIEYVEKLYGRESVAQIITYGTMAAKAVVRDVGRVLGYPYTMVDKLAKLIPHELGITLEKALKEDELKARYQEEDEVRVLIDLALKLEGLARNAGKHAGGVVIAPSKLTDFTALYCEPNGEHLVTQFDKDDIETAGLVKFDFLGLRTLTIIDWAVNAINAKRKQNNESLLNITELPLDDKKTFDLLKSCATSAVFQLESRGMKDLIKRLQPDSFEDIIALVALFRPGPLQSGMVDDFINRKHGRAKMDFFHPLLEPVLRPTYGIILYQEQVMQVAQVLAGYTLGAADLLRRAMGKKKPEEMAKQRVFFITGAKSNNVNSDLATHIFDLMEKFAEYGFNKSHSAAYALITYQTAWLKAHYPAEFMAAVLSSDMDKTDKVVNFLNDSRACGLTIVPPDINRSEYKFRVNEKGEIIYGLGAIKGMGEAAVEAILAARKKHGIFRDLFSFCQQVDLHKINKRTLEALIRSGSMDCLGASRASLMASFELALTAAEQMAHKNALGQGDLFGSETTIIQKPQMIAAEEWSVQLRLQGEKETLGHYLSGHPLQQYENELKNFITAPLLELNFMQNKSVIIAGWVTAIRVMYTKRGDRMAIVTLEDRSGRLEIAVFSEAFNAHKDLLNKDQLLIVEGEVSIDDFTGNNKIITRRLFDITQARETFARHVLLKLHAHTVNDRLLNHVQAAITPYNPGRFPILLEYDRPECSTKVEMGAQWRVQPRNELLIALRKVLGDEAVEVCYY